MARSTRLRAPAAVLTLTALVLTTGSQTAHAHLDCDCTSTHFVDVTFSVHCWNNSTTHSINANESVSFIKESNVECTKGVLSLPGPGYRLVEDIGYYKFHTRLATWEDALRTCANVGANLALPNSDAEAATMATIFQEFPKLSTKDWVNDQAWIGATDFKTEGVFLSLRGRTLKEEGWEHWEEGEPNNEDDGENCAVFNRDQQLTDEACDGRFPFFCERPL